MFEGIITIIQYTMHYTLYNILVQHAMYNVQCTVYIVYCVLQVITKNVTTTPLQVFRKSTVDYNFKGKCLVFKTIKRIKLLLNLVSHQNLLQVN